jgi:hypothetical protein
VLLEHNETGLIENIVPLIQFPDGSDKVHVYRNLHKDSLVIRCSKTGLVAAYCDTVKLTGARFFVSESGRAKVLEKQIRSVHAWIIGTLAAYDFELERDGKTPVYYQPYKTETFMNELTWEPVREAKSVVVCYDRAFFRNAEAELGQLLLSV